MRRSRIELAVGFLLILGYVIWTFPDWHQQPTRITDCLVVLNVVGILLVVHASYQWFPAGNDDAGVA